MNLSHQFYLAEVITYQVFHVSRWNRPTANSLITSPRTFCIMVEKINMVDSSHHTSWISTYGLFEFVSGVACLASRCFLKYDTVIFFSDDLTDVHGAVSVCSLYIFIVYCDLLCFSWSCWWSWSCFSLLSVYFPCLLCSIMFQLIPLMFMELFQFSLCIFFSFIVISYVSVDPADVHGAVSVFSVYIFLVYCDILCFSWSH